MQLGADAPSDGSPVELCFDIDKSRGDQRLDPPQADPTGRGPGRPE